MSRKRACAFLFANDIRFHSQLHTPYGLFASPPFHRVDRSSAVEQIAVAIRVALEHSRDQREMPAGGKEFAKAFLAGMGVKSNAQLQRQSLNVGIEQAGDIAFHPTHNGGSAGDTKGFQTIAGQEVVRVPTDAAPAEITAALLKAFSLCTSVYA